MFTFNKNSHIFWFLGLAPLLTGFYRWVGVEILYNFDPADHPLPRDYSGFTLVLKF